MAKAHHGGADSWQRTTDSPIYHATRRRWCPSCRMHTKSHGLHVHMLLCSNSLYHHMPCNDTRNKFMIFTSGKQRSLLIHVYIFDKKPG